jgi:hypothetical protein
MHAFSYLVENVRAEQLEEITVACLSPSRVSKLFRTVRHKLELGLKEAKTVEACGSEIVKMRRGKSEKEATIGCY